MYIGSGIKRKNLKKVGPEYSGPTFFKFFLLIPPEMKYTNGLKRRQILLRIHMHTINRDFQMQVRTRGEAGAG